MNPERLMTIFKSTNFLVGLLVPNLLRAALLYWTISAVGISNISRTASAWIYALGNMSFWQLVVVTIVAITFVRFMLWLTNIWWRWLLYLYSKEEYVLAAMLELTRLDAPLQTDFTWSSVDHYLDNIYQCEASTEELREYAFSKASRLNTLRTTGQFTTLVMELKILQRAIEKYSSLHYVDSLR